MSTTTTGPRPEKVFVRSYAGEVEYKIGGRRYSVRYFANERMPYAEGYFEGGIKPLVGTVRHDDSADWHGFPPPEVVALFPGFVGARFVRDTFAVECDGPAPALRRSTRVPEHWTCDAAELDD